MVFSSNTELNLYRLAENIFAEIKNFDENLPPEFEIVATIDKKSFILENVYSWSEELLIFNGHEFNSNLPVKFLVNAKNLRLCLSARPLPKERPELKRRPIGFASENFSPRK